VAPATIAPALEGWLVDAGSWSWIFTGGALTAFAALVPIVMTPQSPSSTDATPLRFSLTDFVLLGIAIVSATFALNQGVRWNWFEEPLIVWSSALGLAGILAFVGRQLLSPEPRLLDYSAFGSADFSFAFIVSFVAGAALFGSAYLIPSFAVSVLSFTPTAAGLLLLPSSALFVGALLLSAFLVQKRGVPPIATVPLGILATMAAMWSLSLTTIESGADDMAPAMLLRGVGLGFLFLAITLVAFNTLKPQQIASAVGLFNVGRQLGGLIGVAGLQTLIQHDIAENLSVLSAGIASGAPAAAERLAALTAALSAQGLDAASAQQAAYGVLTRAVVSQATVLAYNTAFGTLALLFVVAAPVMIAVKITLNRKRQTPHAIARSPSESRPSS
jgi:DHA2 family multidrug resistance protein